jgi:hypothetical protein
MPTRISKSLCSHYFFDEWITYWEIKYIVALLDWNKYEAIDLMFVDRCIIIQFIKKNPTRCNKISKFYYFLFTWSSTCFGRHTAHHLELKTALAVSGFSYLEGCWTRSCWTLSGTLCLTRSTDYTSNNLVSAHTVCLTRSANYTSNNLPSMKTQKQPMQ